MKAAETVDWNDFATNAWRTTPCHLLNSPLAALATEREVFEWLVTARDDQAIQTWMQLRVFDGARPVHTSDASVWPLASDHSVDGWFERLRQRHAEPCVLINDFQAINRTLWERTLGALDELERTIGVPSGGALLDLFISNYGEGGGFGLHKDSQDVFTVVLAGTKGFLVWPYSEYEGIDGDTRGPYESAMRPNAMMDSRRATHVLTGQPGEVFYWPCEYWHAARACDKPVCTLSLGVFAVELARWPLTNTVERILHGLVADDAFRARSVLAGAADSDAVVQGVMEEMHRRLGSDVAQGLLRDAILRWHSAFGFRRCLPRTLDEDLEVPVLIRKRKSVRSISCPSGPTLTVYANGVSTPLPNASAVRRVLEALDAGRTLSVEALRRGAVSSNPEDAGPGVPWSAEFADGVVRRLLSMGLVESAA